jgi:hypothetical protein
MVLRHCCRDSREQHDAVTYHRRHACGVRKSLSNIPEDDPKADKAAQLTQRGGTASASMGFAALEIAAALP